MALKIQSSTAQTLQDLLDGKVSPANISALQAVRLAKLGCLEADDKSRLTVTAKAARVLTRFNKRTAQKTCDDAVSAALGVILEEDGTCTQHRQVWVAVGQNEFSRSEVLTSLQSLRDEGVLRSFKSSTNNFQVFWARAEDEAEAGDFEVNTPE